MVFASARSSSTRSTRTERSGSLMVGAAAFTGATGPILRQAFVDPNAQGAAQRQRPLAHVAPSGTRLVGAPDQDEQARMRPDRRADPEETERARTGGIARIRRGCGGCGRLRVVDARFGYGEAVVRRRAVGSIGVSGLV